MRRIGKADAHKICRRLVAQVDARLVRHRVRAAERVHDHKPRDETALRNPDRDLAGESRGRCDAC